MSATVLYTPEVLALSTSLADYPWDESLNLRGEVRSPSCGSTIALALSVDDEGRIARIGIRSHACAIGQAAAAIFAGGAMGRDCGEIAATEKALAAWLAGTGAMPQWRDLEAIAAARAYPARHGAIMLAWRAARELLCTSGLHG